MAEQQPQAQAPQQYRCEKCGHDQGTTGLREVKITVGWEHAAFLCVAPTHMCQRCGDVVVYYNVEIGRFINLVPEQPKRPQRAATLQVVGRTAEPAEPVHPPASVPAEPPQREPFEPIGNTD